LLVTTARWRAIDRLRRDRRFAARLHLLAEDPLTMDPDPLDEASIPDERLELIFTCCHPALALEAQVALTLRTLLGLSTADIARALLSSEEAMKRRLTRARVKIRDAGIPFAVPDAEHLPGRLAAVLGVVYLTFNQGYTGAAELEAEAIRLGDILGELMPGEPEVHGLRALMLLHHARRAARFRDGSVVLLADQDRTLWDREAIAAGRLALAGARSLGGRGPYVVQAAIASAQLAEPVDWEAVRGLYDQLLELTGSPVVALNRAVAVAEAGAPEEALALVDALDLGSYRYAASTRAELLRRLGRDAEAREAYAKALEAAASEAERRFLAGRLATLGA
jgi:RNA polymerase sigma-70 factor (ECF subfamily)